MTKQNEIMISLNAAYYLLRDGDFESFNKIVADLDLDSKSSTREKNVHALLIFIETFEQKKIERDSHLKKIEQIVSLFDDEITPLWLGWGNFLVGFLTKNKETLQKSAEYFLNDQLFSEYYEVVYWMNNFKLLPPLLDYSLFLHCYPVRSTYSRIMGNTFYSEEILSPKTPMQINQTENYLNEDDFDCWIIENNSVMPSTYQKFKLKEDENLLDIYSGLINDRGEYIFLLLSEINTLSLLISSIHIGVSIDQLNNFIEREDGEEILERLRKLGFPVELHNGFYKLKFPNMPKIIMPRTLKVIGLHEFMKRYAPQFDRAKIEEILHVTPYGAELLIKKWALNNLIVPVNSKNNETIWMFKKLF